MDKIDQIYCINLRKRTDRIANFIKSFPNSLINKLKIVGAVNGAKHILSDEEKAKLKNADWDINIKRGVWGCSFSHETIWRNIVEKNQSYAIILEDDAVFSVSFNDDLIKMFDTLNLGICYLGPVNHPENTKEKPHDFSDLVCPGICRIKSNLGSMSYLVSLQGAKDLINIIDTNGHYRAIDWIINDYMKKRGFWVCASPPIFSVQEMGSDI